MSQSPLARTARRSLPAFSHAPSRLSKSHSSRDLAEINESPAPAPIPTSSSSSRLSTLSQTQDTPVRHRTPNNNNNNNNNVSSPMTPKLLYATHALSTPPQSLSKSSSIPFDMAASARAAKRAEEDRRLSTPSIDHARSRKRFVRKKPIFQRITSIPATIYDKFAYASPQSIYDILPDEHLANPISLTIHTIHYLLVYPFFAHRDEYESVLRSGREPSGVMGRWDRWENEGKSQGVGLISGWSKYTLLVLLLLLSIGNAAYLFTRFRTYDMQLRSGSETVHSPHASPVPAPKIKSQPEQDQDVFASSSSGRASKAGFDKYAKMIGKALWFILKFSFYSILSAFGKPQKDAPRLATSLGSNDKIQSLRVWDPPEFCLALFCAFPPTSPLLTHLLVPLHPLYVPLLHLSTTFLLSQLAQFYSQLVKDQMLLSAEVMREYDQRFVYKRVFANKVDKCVGTNEGEWHPARNRNKVEEVCKLM
ncbi:hypothetical protein L486_05252 [Kwoniella mangroviensis CBS 10435]|uniref:Uncharacterized protein n=1 Tax=Kwoniella mangroviensis CBS 10435 TaxID=1331196 RepID=A0A1B9IQJ1_9TREE|nr:hypothetical protein L486_05252 [Kwoniella mangroviensis CBS 10435]OCF75667.1 hypothetical protein I204_02959 [Kwoniella mangroviensis CBS 8886]